MGSKFMKIACPSCGMHYEVDSGSLGRYYRCTECKTLFLGLNAKSVKEPQYVAKEDEEHTGSTAGEDGTAVTENEAEVLESVEVVDDAQEAPVIYPEQIEEPEAEAVAEKSSSITFNAIRITPMQLFGAVAGFFALLLLAAVIAIWMAHSRVNNLRVTHAQGDTRCAELQNAIDKLEYKLEKLADENRQMKLQIKDMTEKIKSTQR